MNIDQYHNSSYHNANWDPACERAMETHPDFFHDHNQQLPYDLIFQNNPTHQILPQSSHNPIQRYQRKAPINSRKQQEQEEERGQGETEEELGATKEMMYRIAAMQPIDLDPTTLRKPTRRNVRVSSDPQSIAARHRRERISERIRILQRLVPGGTKLDTASMLDEAIRYVKFLKKQVLKLQESTQSSPYLMGVVDPNVGTVDWNNSPEKKTMFRH